MKQQTAWPNVEYMVSYQRVFPPEVAETIRAYERIDDRYSLKVVFFYGLWVLCAALMLRFPSPWVIAAGTFVIGVTLHGFGLFLHEALHQHASRRSWMNHLVGFFSGLPILFAYSSYRFVHSRHHSYLRSKGDPDEPLNVSDHKWFVKLVFYAWFIVGVPFYMVYLLIYSLLNGTGPVRRWVIVEYLAIVGTVVAISMIATHGGWFGRVLEFWVFPLGVAILTANVRALSEHCLTGRDPVSMARTVISNPIVRFFYSGENYHTIHHLAPKVPGWALRDLHEKIRPHLVEKGLIECPSYARFLWNALKKGPYGVDESVQAQAAGPASGVATAA